MKLRCGLLIKKGAAGENLSTAPRIALSAVSASPLPDASPPALLLLQEQLHVVGALQGQGVLRLLLAEFAAHLR